MSIVEEDENSIKIVLLGDSGVGKTSIVTKFVTGSIPDIAVPTVGAAFVTKEQVINDIGYRLLIWDTAGQELYRGLAPMYYRNALIAIIVFDLSKSSTFNSVEYWINELNENSEEDVLILICGNKCDLDRDVESGIGENIAQTNKAIYAETSATTGAGIDRLFQVAVSELEKRRSFNKKDLTAQTVDIQEAPPMKKDKGCC